MYLFSPLTMELQMVIKWIASIPERDTREKPISSSLKSLWNYMKALGASLTSITRRWAEILIELE